MIMSIFTREPSNKEKCQPPTTGGVISKWLAYNFGARVILEMENQREEKTAQ